MSDSIQTIELVDTLNQAFDKINENFQVVSGGTVTVENTNTVTNQGGGTLSFWSGTQAQYDALPSYEATTLYFIVE